MLIQSSHGEERSLWGWDPRGLFFDSTVRVVVRGLAAHVNPSSSDTIELFIAEFSELIDAERMPMIFGDGHNMLR